MKWIKQDFYDNHQVWYSEDVINKIKDICNIYKDKEHCAIQVMEIIESEDK